MGSFEKFSEYKLSDKCQFYSSLKDECVYEKDYLHANNVWNMFKMNTKSDYHDLYLKTVIMLLVDVFEKFISVFLEQYGLDPCHCFSSQGLNWDPMLKMSKTELDLSSDIYMYLFVKKRIKGDIFYIAKRFSKSNNKYMQFYDDKNPSKYITYLDTNNLHGQAMSQYLSCSRFKWLNQKEIDKFYLTSIDENSSVGYILDVSFEYSDELHDIKIGGVKDNKDKYDNNK